MSVNQLDERHQAGSAGKLEAACPACGETVLSEELEAHNSACPMRITLCARCGEEAAGWEEEMHPMVCIAAQTEDCTPRGLAAATAPPAAPSQRPTDMMPPTQSQLRRLHRLAQAWCSDCQVFRVMARIRPKQPRALRPSHSAMCDTVFYNECSRSLLVYSESDPALASSEASLSTAQKFEFEHVLRPDLPRKKSVATPQGQSWRTF